MLISQTKIIIIVCSLTVCILLPLILGFIAVFRNKLSRRNSIKTLFVGVGIFLLFAIFLESPFRKLANYLKANPFLYALYGSFLAGIFEEVGRWLGLKFIEKHIAVKDNTAPLLYGIGHGGAEMLIVGGLSMINYLVYAILINQNEMPSLLSKVPHNMQYTVQTMLNQFIDESSIQMSLSIVERLLAFIVQIALTYITWLIIRRSKPVYWILLPIVLHALIDFPAALAQVGAIGISLVEVLLSLFTLLLGTVTFCVWRQSSRWKNENS